MSHLLKQAHRRLVLDQTGSVLIEALISGVLLVVVSLGVLGGFETANRTSSEERHRARAQSIAQEDLARLRAMSISDLSAMQSETRNVPVEGTTYVVTSTRQYMTDTTGTASCTPGTSSADYIRISSTVDWPTRGSRPAVVATSLVSPPAGSISPNSGALAVSVQGASGTGISNVGISGSGAASFSGTTSSTGCIIFGNLPAGNYTVSLTGLGASLVDTEGNSPSPRTTSVVAEATNTLVLQYDNPGEIPVQFTTRSYPTVAAQTGTNIASAGDSLVTFHSLMQTAGNMRIFGTIGSQQTELRGDPMFPFTSPYTVFAGHCAANNPITGSPAAPAAGNANVNVPPGGNATTSNLQLPPMHVTVYRGTSGTPSTPASGATVKIRDVQSGCNNQLRTFTTNAAGQIPNPGLPYGQYSICASGSSTSGNRSMTLGSVFNAKTTGGLNPTTSSTGGTSGTGWNTSSTTTSSLSGGLRVYLASGTSSPSTCP